MNPDDALITRLQDDLQAESQRADFLSAAVENLERQIKRLQATNAELNRRVQRADAALAEATKGENGPKLRRGLARMWKDRAEAAERDLARERGARRVVDQALREAVAIKANDVVDQGEPAPGEPDADDPLAARRE